VQVYILSDGDSLVKWSIALLGETFTPHCDLVLLQRFLVTSYDILRSCEVKRPDDHIFHEKSFTLLYYLWFGAAADNVICLTVLYQLSLPIYHLD